MNVAEQTDTRTEADPTSDNLSQAIRGNDEPGIQFWGMAMLLRGPVDTVRFRRIARLILSLGKMSPEWRTAFEIGYDRLEADKRILVRDEMGELYCHFGQYGMALKFVAPEPATLPELELAMTVYLQLGRFDDARNIAELCGQGLVTAWNGQAFGQLLGILKRYREAIGKQPNRRQERRTLFDLVLALEREFTDSHGPAAWEKEQKTDKQESLG